VPLLPVIRLTAIELAEGCTKSTVSFGAMLKLAQVSESTGLVCVTVVREPDCPIWPDPETTWPPRGAASVSPAASDMAAASSVFAEPLPRPRVVSATGTQLLEAWLHTSRKIRLTEAWRCILAILG
jgi:hypothetical protein